MLRRIVSILFAAVVLALAAGASSVDTFGVQLGTAPAAGATRCLFCGVPRVVSDAVIWIVVHGDSGLPEPGATVFPPDDAGNPPDWFPPPGDFSNGGRYKGWRVVCDFSGCSWVYDPDGDDYRMPEPPAGNWWDGWDGDCNNPPVDPTGQEVWSWC